nr:MAG TPA: hypothetical protein [Crassvirales sp.]
MTARLTALSKIIWCRTAFNLQLVFVETPDIVRPSGRSSKIIGSGYYKYL